MPKRDLTQALHVLVEVVRTCGLGLFALGCTNALIRGTGAGALLLLGGLALMFLSAAAGSLARRSANPQPRLEHAVESGRSPETWTVSRSR